jgi:hypothetical protein
MFCKVCERGWRLGKNQERGWIPLGLPKVTELLGLEGDGLFYCAFLNGFYS